MSQQYTPSHLDRVIKDRVLNGRADMSPDMALRLTYALGGSAESWLHMQANFDLWQARQKPSLSENTRITKRIIKKSVSLGINR